MLKIQGELDELGALPEVVDNYFPRNVKDYKALAAEIERRAGPKARTRLEDMIHRWEKKNGRRASDIDRGEIINNFFKGADVTPKRSFTKERKWEVVPSWAEKYYDSPAESLQKFLFSHADEIETRKFFGVSKKKGEFDLDKSIGGVLENWKKKGVLQRFVDADGKEHLIHHEGKIKLQGWQEEELKHLLNLRFGKGRELPSTVLKDLKKISYASLLANPYAALTQAGDLGPSLAINGTHNTIYTAIKRMFKFANREAQLIHTESGLGVGDAMLELTKAGEFEKWAFKWSGFKWSDQAVGKNIFIESALRRASKIVNKDGSLNSQNFVDVYNKYAGAWGDEKVGQLVTDLRKFRTGEIGKPTETLKEFMFMELADVQPITRSEVPAKYLAMPNGNAIYMLKTWSLKQIDIMRNQGYNQIRQGIELIQESRRVSGGKVTSTKGKRLVREGATTTAQLIAYLGALGTGADFLKDLAAGKEFKAEDIPDKFAENTLQLFFLDRYSVSSFEKDGPMGWILDQVSPAPIDQARVLWRGIKAEAEGDEANQLKYGRKITSWTPIIGKVVSNHFLGGKEYENERRDKERRDKKRKKIIKQQDQSRLRKSNIQNKIKYRKTWQY
jgi:hypothetical protein